MPLCRKWSLLLKDYYQHKQIKTVKRCYGLALHIVSLYFIYPGLSLISFFLSFLFSYVIYHCEMIPLLSCLTTRYIFSFVLLLS